MSLQRPAVAGLARFALLVWLLTMPAWAPLTRAGLPPTQTGPLPVLKLYAVEGGAAPAWADSSPFWSSEGNWPYGIARIFRLLGAGGATAIHWAVGLALIILALGLSGWATQMAGYKAGLLAALLLVYNPIYLSLLYRGGEPGVVWALAGLALAGWGLFSSLPGGRLLAGAGIFIALLSQPGMGLIAAAALLCLALAARRWLGAVLVALGAGLGWLAATPTLATSPLPAALPRLYQLIEPGWSFDTGSLTWDTPLSYSLGLPLLALLLLVLWAGPRPSRPSVFPFLPLSLGFLLTALALLLPAGPGYQSPITSYQLLLLALPFLALSAAHALNAWPGLRHTPLWAGLLLLPILGAGPGLAPQFSDYPIARDANHAFAGGQILLTSVRTGGNLAPDTIVTVEATWVALAEIDFDYNIFLQALDAAGNKVAQLDIQPQAGARPMTTWRRGEPIADSYELAIPAGAPAGLHLQFGLYNWQTLQRLPVGEGDAIELAP